MQKWNFYKEYILVTITIVLFTILNQIHIIIQLLRHKASETFIGITHFYADFFLYVSQMAQGARGSWIWASHMYTNEPLPPTFIYWLNVASGHIGGFFGLAPYTTYNVLLAILVVILLALWYKVCLTIYPNHRLRRVLCFFLIITSSSFIDYALFLKTGKIDLLGKLWFSPAPAFNRLGGVPHQVFQSISILLFLFILSQCFEPKKYTRDTPKLYTLLTLVTANTAAANPMQMLILVVVTILTMFFSLGVQKTNRLTTLLTVAIVLGISFIFAYLTNEQTKIPVFVTAKQWELMQWVDRNPWHFLLTFGPSLIFIPFGLIPFMRSLTTFTLMLITYGLVSVLFFFSPIPAMLFTTPIRYLSPVSHTAFLILAAFGIFEIAHFLNQKVQSRVIRKTVSTQVFTILIFTMYLILTIPSLYAQIQKKADPTGNPYLLQETIYNHVPIAVRDLLTQLNAQPTFRNDAVVLTDPMYSIEILVPVFTDKSSFTGHPLHTLYPDYKETLRKKFFDGLMTAEEIPTFLTNHRIGFVIASKNKPLLLQSVMLSKIYETSQAILYRVVK